MITLQLDKERHAKLTLGGMKKFQEKTGKSLLKGFSMAELTEDDAIALVWACLVWEDPTLTIETVETFDINVISQITSTVTGSSPNPESRPTG